MRLNLQIVMLRTIFSLALVSGSYAQSPSGLPKASIFLAGVFSGRANDGAPTSSPGGETLYSERVSGRQSSIYESRNMNGAWTAPVVASFSDTFRDQQPALSPDGRHLLYISSRKVTTPDGAKPVSHIYQVNQSGNAWSAPQELPKAVNVSDLTFKPTVASNGDLYFMAATSSSKGGPAWQIYCSAFVSGRNRPSLPVAIKKTSGVDVDPYIAADGSFLDNPGSRVLRPIQQLQAT